jgi:hypothetical protein
VRRPVSVSENLEYQPGDCRARYHAPACRASNLLFAAAFALFLRK